MQPSNPTSSLLIRRLARLAGSPWFYCGLLVASLGIAPFFYFPLDVVGFHLPWATATKGLYPWAVYTHPPGCLYPPLVPCFLTLVQQLRICTGATAQDGRAILLAKLPSIIALAAGCAAIKRLGRPVLGLFPAAAAGVLFAVCPALWFNACVWGQWDAILTLVMILTVLASLRDRPAWAGVGVGVGLAVKLQSIVIVPVLLILIFHRQKISGLIRMTGAAALCWAALAAPFFIAGTGRQVLQSYTQAVGKYPALSVTAYNAWAISPRSRTLSDTLHLIGALSARSTGLALLGLFNLFLVAAVSSKPKSETLVILAAALASLGFYQLPTQMHERYGLPACGFLALLAGRGHWLWFCLLTTTMTINQFDVMAYPTWPGFRVAVLSFINIAVLIAASIDLARQALQPAQGAPC